jgi:hypothetical protein
MRDRGIIETSQVDAQVADILTWNDKGFESMSKMIARQPMSKQASMPVVGMLSSSDVILPSASASGEGSGEVRGFFDSYFANKKF